jgi:hypothetical protein
MKNVTVFPRRQVFRIKIEGMGPLRGWALKLVSNLNNDYVKPGFWLSMWNLTPRGVEFAFEEDLQMTYTTEEAAQHVADDIRNNTDIVTEVVRIDGYAQGPMGS